MIDVTVVDRPSSIGGAASGSSTFVTSCQRLAPSEDATSSRPGSTSLIAISTMRAKNGIATADKGTIAAVGPMKVPTRARVTGMSATIRMMKGTDRPKFTMRSRTRLITSPAVREPNGRSRKRPGSVPTSTTPSGSPIRTVNTSEMLTM